MVPPVVNIDDAYVAGGSCTSGAGAIFCQLGDVPGGAARAVNLTLRSDVIGTSSVSLRIASDNDAVLANNLGSGELNVQQESDLGVALAGPATAVVGSDLRLTFTASNYTATAAPDVRVRFDLPNGLIAGDVAHWIETIERFSREYRMDTFIFWPVAGDELLQIEVYAREVVPAVSARLG